MKKNNISMQDIPNKNEKVYLRHNSNVAKGDYVLIILIKYIVLLLIIVKEF